MAPLSYRFQQTIISLWRFALLISVSALVALATDATPPTIISVTPSSGSGLTQSFAFLSSDPDGGTNISGLQLLFASTSGGYANACDFWIDRGSSGIWLRNDANTGWGNPVIAGQAGTLQNSQCSLNSVSSSIVATASTLPSLWPSRSRKHSPDPTPLLWK